MWMFNRLRTVFNKWNRPRSILALYQCISNPFEIYWYNDNKLRYLQIYFRHTCNLSIYCACSSHPAMEVPSSSLTGYSPTEWITSQLFVNCFDHSMKMTNSTEDDSLMLIYDGHFLHTSNTDLIDMVRKNYVYLVPLPPHTSNKMQSLNISIIKHFNSYYSMVIKLWMDTNSGKVKHFQVAKLFYTLYERAVTIETDFYHWHPATQY